VKNAMKKLWSKKLISDDARWAEFENVLHNFYLPRRKQ
jgi:hypothetical protein